MSLARESYYRLVYNETKQYIKYYTFGFCFCEKLKLLCVLLAFHSITGGNY